MRTPNQITSNFYSINQDLIERKSDLIYRFPKLKTYNYHLGIFREELLKSAIIKALRKEPLPEMKNIKISSGFIKDATGALSNQVDILIFRKDSKTFKYGMFDIVDINDTIGAIEVKSKIEKDTLMGKHGALVNTDSIRDLKTKNGHHVFTAIIGFESIRDIDGCKNYLLEHYKPKFDLGINHFCDVYNQLDRKDLATKKFTPDLIVSLDGLLVLFGVQVDLISFSNRPALFISKPKVKEYTSLQYLYFELLSYIILQTGTNDRINERLFDYLNFDFKERKDGYSIENIMGIDWDNYKYLN